jgi:hypothetical protein
MISMVINEARETKPKPQKLISHFCFHHIHKYSPGPKQVIETKFKTKEYVIHLSPSTESTAESPCGREKAGL